MGTFSENSPMVPPLQRLGECYGKSPNVSDLGPFMECSYNVPLMIVIGKPLGNIPRTFP